MVAFLEGCCPRNDSTAARPQALKETVIRSLYRWFPPRRAAYVADVLTEGELAVIADPCDALILARIKRMSDARLRRFDRLVPADAQHHQLFRTLQMNWLRDEEYLLSTRLGRRPTPKELFIDFMHHKNGIRFRAYFAMKYPGRMKPVCASAE
jgi:hypothetical protein